MITDTWISKTMAMDNVHTHRIQDLKQQLYLLALMMCPDRIMKTNLSAVKNDLSSLPCHLSNVTVHNRLLR